MLRAAELLAGLAPPERSRVASRLGADTDTVDGVCARMRSAEVVPTVLAHCASGLLREDLLLLTANPFAAVASDEVADPGLLLDLGLLGRGEAGTYRVNLDLALTLLPALPLEFGYALTLVARLDSARLWALGRSLGIGPRPERVELLLALAEGLVARDGVMGRLARLTEAERSSVASALGEGELPDDLAADLQAGPPPTVVPAAGVPGASGLLFDVVQPARGGARRSVVPLELQPVLGRWLAAVPGVAARDTAPAPPVRGAPARRRRAPRTEPVLPSLDMDLTVRGVRETGDFAGLPASVFGGGARSAVGAPTCAQPTPAPLAVVRTVRAEPAGALVDLESAAAVERMLGSADLRAGVVGVYGDRWVALREGVDPARWCRQAALHLDWIER